MKTTAKPDRILLVARVSRSADNSTPVARQLSDGREHAARHWPGVPIVEYVDDGVSGAVDPAKRPELGQAMRAATFSRGVPTARTIRFRQPVDRLHNGA